jgi:hypothetical protein
VKANPDIDVAQKLVTRRSFRRTGFPSLILGTFTVIGQLLKLGRRDGRSRLGLNIHLNSGIFLVEGAKYNVFPLDDHRAARENSDLAGRPDLMASARP